MSTVFSPAIALFKCVKTFFPSSNNRSNGYLLSRIKYYSFDL